MVDRKKRIHHQGHDIELEPGDVIDLGFSERFTPRQLQSRLEEAELQPVETFVEGTSIVVMAAKKPRRR